MFHVRKHELQIIMYHGGDDQLWSPSYTSMTMSQRGDERAWVWMKLVQCMRWPFQKSPNGFDLLRIACKAWDALSWGCRSFFLQNWQFPRCRQTALNRHAMCHSCSMLIIDGLPSFQGIKAVSKLLLLKPCPEAELSLRDAETGKTCSSGSIPQRSLPWVEISTFLNSC